MDSVKWKCKNGILYFMGQCIFLTIFISSISLQKSWTCSAFIQFFSIVMTNLTITCEILTFFLKKIHQKWKYYREEEQDFERFLIFNKIKMLEKSKQKKKKKKNSMKSLQLCGEEKRASGMSSPLCIGTKMKKTKV